MMLTLHTKIIALCRLVVLENKVCFMSSLRTRVRPFMTTEPLYKLSQLDDATYRIPRLSAFWFQTRSFLNKPILNMQTPEPLLRQT